MTTQNALNNQTVNANFTTNRTDSGSQALNTVAHSQNTAGSDAVHRAQVAGTSAGDAFVELAAGAARSYALGIDTSTTDQDLKLTTATAATVTPSTGTTVITLDMVSPDTFPRLTTEVLISQFQYTAPGNSVQVQINNPDTTNLASNALLAARTEVGGGDPYIAAVIGGVLDWNIGQAKADNSLRMTTGGGPSAGTEFWRMRSTGERTMPLQPAFYGVLSAQDNNVTGAGATYLLGSGNPLTIIQQQGTGLATNGVYTTPVQGFYHFDASIYVLDITAAMTQADFYFNVNGATFIYGQQINAGAVRTAANTLLVSWSSNIFLGAGQTVQPVCVLSAGAGNTADIAAGIIGAFVTTAFSGYLIC